MKLSRRQVFIILFLLGLFMIFFVGREFNPETGKRSLIITSDGVNHFRKGLDVSGGTKLVYKISYEKYEEIYKDPQELNEVKKLIETIVLKNIDKRISKLGVSDYKAYIQNLNEQHYIVVEIGGIADLDQAKEIIGKTVELEFRLPNEQEPSEQLVLERKQKAQTLLQDIQNNPDKMFEFADGRGAENIFYGSFPDASLSQLPDIYQDNLKLLNSMELGEFSDILEGTYANIQNPDQNGLLSNNELKGYSFFRILDKKVEEKTFIVGEDIIQTANSLGLKNDKIFSKQDTQLSKDEYEYVGKDLIFNLGEIGSGQNAYDIKVVGISKKSSLGLSELEVKELEDAFDLEVDSVVKSIDKKGFDLKPGHKLLNDERIPQSDLLKIVTNFDSIQTDKVQKYNRFDTTYVVYIRDQKSPQEKLYSTIKVWGVNQDEFEDNLKKTIIYDIEDVFVQDRETWKMAIGPKTNSVLNGAYFKFANVSSSQMGQPVVLINFDDAGQEIFCEITEANIGNQMAIFVGGLLLTSPTIQSKICGGGAQIDGQFTSESARDLVNSLNDGALPAPLILMQEEKVSPTLGDSAFTGSLIATVVGIIAIYLLMLFMYKPKKSLVALITLVTFIIILAGLLKLIDYALSLSGIAAVVLSLGMAVDANVLIFERLREELKEGKSISSAIDLAVSRSRNAIRDGQISTGLIALVLFSMGVSIFKGFGSMMLLTIILTLLVNVPLTKELLKIFYIKKQ